MKPSQQIGRNEPCPCGSGRKFKLCCQGKSLSPSGKRSPARYVALGVAGVLLAIVVGVTALGPTAERTESGSQSVSSGAPAPTPTAATVPQARRSGYTPQPPGPTPEGKVWSPEHGHWHDAEAAGGQVIARSGNLSTRGGPSNPAPQPPGPVPEGKVWSPEHGHWHDAAPQIAVPRPIAPPSAAPEAAAPGPQ